MAIHTQDSSTAPVDSNGVLNALIQQVSDSSPQYSKNGFGLTTKFKGPYNVLKDANNLVDQTLSGALLAIGIDTYTNFNFPAPPPGMAWWVTSTQLQQTEAGDHGILTIACEAKDASGGGSRGKFDPYQDTWQLRWESYTVKPQAFCSNKGNTRYLLTNEDVHEGNQLSGYANREWIDTFLNGSDKGINKGHKWYRDNTGTAYYLNTAEELITNKSLQDKSALYHYPVLTHTTVKNYYSNNISSVLSNNTSFDETLGEHIDYIVGGSANPSAAPEGCPYTFGDDPRWVWVKTGDDMRHVKDKTKISFTRTQTYMGVISADINYYGDVTYDHTNLSACRWKVGEL